MPEFAAPSSPSTRVRLAKAPWYVACALVLAACAAPPTPPGVQVGLDTASVAVVRGTTADVQVTLTRLGGAADPVELSVDGLPSGVDATFSPATLDGGTLTSTLTISADPAAAEGVTALTVEATSGSLSDDAALSLAVESLTVTGRVQGVYALPVVGATVASQGESDFSDATGTFTLSGLSVPYDVTVSNALGNGNLHVYEGMTSSTPILRPLTGTFAPPPVTSTATITGSVIGGAIEVGEVVVVCVEGLAIVVIGCDAIPGGSADFSIAASWPTGADVATRLHALHVEQDGDGNAVAYLGYETIALNLGDGDALLADLDLDPVGTATLTGTTSYPVSLTDAGLGVSVRFGPNLSIPLFAIEDPGDTFDLLVPEASGFRYDAYLGAADATSVVYTWTVDAGLDLDPLVITGTTQLGLPADGALDVDLTTPFSANGTGGALTYAWIPVGAGPVIGLTTTRTTVTIPDPADGGFAFPAGLAYEWGVLGHGGDSVDTAAAGGFADFTAIASQFAGSDGGPSVDADRTFSPPTTIRDFTFAP